MSSGNEDTESTPTQEGRADQAGFTNPPSTFSGIIRRLGPGLIIAGSIVGSGELIATTKTGAEAGIALLWLIVIGCLIKVFVQVEMGRHAITHGELTLSSLDALPGPRCRVNWILWFWIIMTACTIGQQGGIVGGVGQALALTFPLKGDYLQAIRIPSQTELERFVKWEKDRRAGDIELHQRSTAQQKRIVRGHEVMQDRINQLGPQGDQVLAKIRSGESVSDPWTVDDKIWAAVIAFLTAWILYHGRYRSIQNISTVLVVSFTAITISNVVSLQTTDRWSIPLSDFFRGLSFGPPEPVGKSNPWLTALATFGIIGVGASELIAYPYWCLEKGYGRFTGRRSDDASWAQRARGWLRVMYYDVFASMIIYTVATMAFFLMGVAVLYNDGLDPDGMRMVSTLAEAYVPVFGVYAKWLFLAGAVAVLYSTFMVSSASNARMLTDAAKLFRIIDRDKPQTHQRSVAVISAVLPLISLTIYLTGANPVTLVLISGTMQATMLPVLGYAALHFRYRKTDPRLKPSLTWDVFLIISCLGLLIAGLWGIYSRIA